MPRLRRFAVCAAGTALLVCVPAGAATLPRTTPIVVKVARGGFSLADAAVGAVAGAGGMLAAIGCVVLLRLRREETQHRTKGDAP